MKSVVCFLILTFLSLNAFAAPKPGDPPRKPRNIILFVADGGGPASFTMARDFLRETVGPRAGLALDSVLAGSIRTYSADSRVTDSAAGATAFAAGVKTYNGAIAVDTAQRPVTTVLEEAEARGLSTGMVATSRITHATPAAFSSHVPSRNMEAEIAAQQIGKGIEVIFGGGRRFFLPTEAGGSRRDGRDLLEEARTEGYRIAGSRQAFDSTGAGPVLGLFTMDHMAYEIDRDETTEPSLAEMTTKAIDLLDDDPDGFFLLVEGSRIDHAAHANDPAAHLHDVLAYDQAVAAALAFARRDGETLVIATADHETGGLTLGRDVAMDPEEGAEEAASFGRSLEATSVYDWRPSVIARVTSSVEPMVAALREEGSDPADVLRTYAGVEDLTASELELLGLAMTGSGRLDHVVGELISRRAVIAWTTGGHTAVDVGLYAYGPGAERLRGHHENTAIGRVIADLLDLELDPLSETVVD